MMTEEKFDPNKIFKKFEKMAYLKDVKLITNSNPYLVAESINQDNMIRISDWVLREMKSGEFSALITHELSHLGLKHWNRYSIIQFIRTNQLSTTIPIIIAASILFPIINLLGFASDGWLIVSLMLLTVLFWFILVFFSLNQKYIRDSEFQADYLAVILCQSPNLVKLSLEKSIKKIEKLCADEKNMIKRHQLKKIRKQFEERVEQLSKYNQNKQ